MPTPSGNASTPWTRGLQIEGREPQAVCLWGRDSRTEGRSVRPWVPVSGRSRDRVVKYEARACQIASLTAGTLPTGTLEELSRLTNPDDWEKLKYWAVADRGRWFWNPLWVVAPAVYTWIRLWGRIWTLWSLWIPQGGDPRNVKRKIFGNLARTPVDGSVVAVAISV